MPAAPLLTLAAEGALSGVNHWFVGAGVLILLALAMFALLAFGAGRDHS